MHIPTINWPSEAQDHAVLLPPNLELALVDWLFRLNSLCPLCRCKTSFASFHCPHCYCKKPSCLIPLIPPRTYINTSLLPYLQMVMADIDIETFESSELSASYHHSYSAASTPHCCFCPFLLGSVQPSQ